MSNELTDYQLVVKVRCHGETLDELQEQISQTIAEYVDADTDTFDIKYVEEAKRDEISEILDREPLLDAIYTPERYDDEEGQIEATLTCPHCESDEVVEVDMAERWNSLTEGDKDYVHLATGDNGDYDGDGWLCTACMKRLNAPDRFTDPDFSIDYD